MVSGDIESSSENNNEKNSIKSTTNRSSNQNCDTFGASETNERQYVDATAAVANSCGGISSDSGVSFDLGLDDADTDEDPYAELEFYLEKVKVSVIFCWHFSCL